MCVLTVQQLATFESYDGGGRSESALVHVLLKLLRLKAANKYDWQRTLKVDTSGEDCSNWPVTFRDAAGVLAYGRTPEHFDAVEDMVEAAQVQKCRQLFGPSAQPGQ